MDDKVCPRPQKAFVLAVWRQKWRIQLTALLVVLEAIISKADEKKRRKGSPRA